jgi:hypothetical protein
MSLLALVEHLNFYKIRREIPLLLSGALNHVKGSQDGFGLEEMIIILEFY